MPPADGRVASLLWLASVLPGGVRRARNGRLSAGSMNGLPPNVRLRRYLARTLAWPKVEFSDEYDTLAHVVFFPTLA